MKAMAVAAAGFVLVANGALAQDFDLAAGEKVFGKCKACHAVGPDAKNKVGPELNGVVGRPWGAIEGFKYSEGKDDTLKALGDGKVWDVTTLGAYLTNPKDVIPKGKMAFAGLKKPEDIANVIAYLAQYEADGATTDPAAVLQANGGS